MSDLFCFVLFFSLGESLEVVGGGGLSSALFINLTSPNLWVKKTPKQLKNTASRGTTATDKEASKARTAPESFFFFFWLLLEPIGFICPPPGGRLMWFRPDGGEVLQSAPHAPAAESRSGLEGRWGLL